MLRKDEFSSQDELKIKLKELIPSAFEEGELNIEKLQSLIGSVESEGQQEKERFGMQWVGKAEAIQSVQLLGEGTLRPDNGNVDKKTENLIIEGDNLEVLKILQKSYYSKIKYIIIDPPYNTGNEFIYPDDFKEGIDGYLKYSGQIDENGLLVDSQAETSGRLHSKWLNMIYPRLFLARNLLKEDGLIFVSIDDNEVHNLKMIMNEIFGEENFVAQLVWQKKTGAGAKSKGFITLHEYILCYAKNKSDEWNLIAPLSEKTKAMYNKKDEYFETLGPYATWPLDTTSMADRPNLRFPIDHEGYEIWPSKQWLWSRERVEKAQQENKLVFNHNEDEDTWSVRFKGYLYGEDGEIKPGKPTSLLIGPYTQQGTKDFEKFFSRDVFPFPKPVDLIKQLLSIKVESDTAEEELILDFFAGSGTTAQAVMDLNKEDKGNRKFILIQLPEPVEHEEFKTIVDITKERVVRAANELEVDPCLGFFKLDSSNFLEWSHDITSPEQISEQMEAWRYPIKEGRDTEDVLYEVLLKGGFELTADIQKHYVDNSHFFSVQQGDQKIVIYLAPEKISEEILKLIKEIEPSQVWILDEAFEADDEKKNIELQWKEEGIAFRTI